ncbi:MAG: SUMF1/EgtB/PvdO family nonheme iron enzyme [Proteobacteria bacterium]|nr:SUMF1/EgtB/PvdO family nonheme iron enzyme [Pseudomonadota bacterium]
MAPARVSIPAGQATVGGDWGEVAFGWDNEFPAHRTEAAAFAIDELPVTIARYQAFVEATGAETPLDWEGDRLRTMWGTLPLDRVGGLPVCVSQQQAAAFATWAGGRLPTEAELHRASEGASPVLTDWAASGPEPVGAHPEGVSDHGVQELIGNGWEHTGTPFAGLPGFDAWMRTYPGYSTDFFDGKHYVVFGAAWPTAPQLTRASFRNWYFGHYPYAFNKFRVVYPG